MPEISLPLTSLLAAGAAAPPLFSLLAVMLIAVVVVSLLLLRLRGSLLVGYFICGIIIANSGLMDRTEGGDMEMAISQMAEFGVMLLMFVLGMEFSISELKYLRRFSLIGGGLQMAACGVLAMAVAKFSGLSWPAAIVLGVALAMSSTAVSLKTFQDMGLSGTPGARFALGIAIFQDLVIIAFLVVLPLLLGSADATGAPLHHELGWLVGRGGAFVLLSWVIARWIFPNLLHAVARTRSRELFTLTVVGCCIGLAWVAALLQLSLALGAFVAGLVVSESVYKHRIMADIMPIKDVFLTLFFVSVGLMIDLSVALPAWKEILAFTLILMAGKAMLITGIAFLLGQTNRAALVGSFSLCSAGEFSLLLLQKAGAAGLWEAELQQALIASGTVSMALVPGLMRLADPVASWMGRVGWGRRQTPKGAAQPAPMRERVKSLTGHAILCGYGPVGRHLNESLLGAGVPTLVIELNADTVHELMRHGQPVLFADAAHEETWELARVRDAVLVAFTFPDASSAAAGLRHVRELNPEVCILARARFSSDQARLERLGASVVVHDEGVAARAVADKGLQIASRSAPSES
ncbi:MAG: cation:proton antiporter [Verrucomicrobiales bacterium]|nr:cation:proton antiporter [Verrucomicrobiales bacterium]